MQINHKEAIQHRYLLLFPDGIGFRNFVMTDFIKHLIRDGEVVIWHAIPEELTESYQKQWNGKVTWFSLPPHHEGQLPFITRRAKQMAQLYWQDEPGTEVVLEAMLSRPGSGWRGVRNRIANSLGRVNGRSSHGVLFLNSLHQYSVRHTRYFHEYVALLRQVKPDVVFCSHQRSEIAVPVMLAARYLGIPTVTFIYSWDNLPKGRMAVNADYYFVWSQHMKEEMLHYYPDVREEQIFIVGTPQFEHYFNPSLLESRSEFFGRYGLDPDRKVICFSGDDLSTSPLDHEYLADLAEALRAIPEAYRPQILFRRNPTDSIDRYRSTLDRYPEIHISDPAWVTLSQNDWTKVVPTAEDTKLLANVVHHCDIVINVGSTMALDFAIVKKPAIYLRYPPSSWNPNMKWSIEQVYRYPHYNFLPRIHPVTWVYSREDLASTVMHVLDHPQELQSEREKWVNFLVQSPLDKASERCAETLKQIAGAS